MSNIKLIFVPIQLFFTFIFYFYMTRYSYKTIPLFTHLSLILSLYMCLIIAPILLFDIIQNDNLWLYTSWHLLFFATQILSWIVLPILQSYDLSYELTIIKKIKSSIIENAKIYIIYGAIFLSLLIYVVLIERSSLKHFISLCTIIANAFGFILLVMFLSYGLVDIPKKLLKLAFNKNTLNNILIDISIHESNYELEKCELKSTKNIVSGASKLIENIIAHTETSLTMYPYNSHNDTVLNNKKCKMQIIILCEENYLYKNKISEYINLKNMSNVYKNVNKCVYIFCGILKTYKLV
jgi:hypothetical protein